MMQIQHEEKNLAKNNMIEQWLNFNESSLRLAYVIGLMDYKTYHWHWKKDLLDFPFKSE